MSGTDLSTGNTGLLSERRILTAGEVLQHTLLVQHVMKSVMKLGEHYGDVPGCNKPSLFKSGAEKLNVVFRLAPHYDEMPGTKEDDDHIIYKIRCTLRSQISGEVVATGLGACNSKEKKYRTRSVYLDKATDEEKAVGKQMERLGKNGKPYSVLIVPQDPWDIQNTLYKMACKRALIAATLNGTAASDLFTQDVEDLEDRVVIEAEYAASRTVPDVKSADEAAAAGEFVPAPGAAAPAATAPTAPAAAKPATEPGANISVRAALALKDKDVVNIEAVFCGMTDRQVGKDSKTVYDYTLCELNPPAGEKPKYMVVSSWTKYDKLVKDEPVEATRVSVKDIHGNLKYTASGTIQKQIQFGGTNGKA